MPFQPAVSEPPRLTYRLPEDISPAAVEALDTMLSAALQSGLALLAPPQQEKPAPGHPSPRTAPNSKPTAGAATAAARNTALTCKAVTTRGLRCQRASAVGGLCKQHHNRRQADETETEPGPLSASDNGTNTAPTDNPAKHASGTNAMPAKPAGTLAQRQPCEHCGGLMKRQTSITAAGRSESLTCLSCGRDAPDPAVATA